MQSVNQRYACWLAAVLAISGPVLDTRAGTGIFSCDFKGKLAPEWKVAGGKWELNGECLAQTDDGPADPKKALLLTGNPEALSTNVIVVAKVRIDSWPKQSDSRIGITVCSDPESGRGYNLVFHQGRLQFMRDYVAWGEGAPFPYESGKWYWLKLRKEADELEGKAWKDGEPEPTDWMVAWNEDQDEALGYPGLNGGSLGGPARLSFAEFRVERIAGPEESRRPESADLGLDGTWQVRPESKGCIGVAGLRQVGLPSEGWMAAQVPGEIHLDLMKAGKMPDPAAGLNMPKCRWPETNSWWYRTVFEVAPDFLRYERQRLVFDGLDLYAQVFLNGNLVGEAADAFVPAAFDVKRWVHAGRNELVVRLTDGSELVPADAGGNSRTFQWGGRIWLRKPQFAWGWDWVDGLPNIGIWRSARLEGRRRAVLHQVRLDTVRHNGRVCLEMEAVLENLSPTRLRACTLALEIQPPGGATPIAKRYPAAAPPGRMPVRDLIEIPGPSSGGPTAWENSRSTGWSPASPMPRAPSLTIGGNFRLACERLTWIAARWRRAPGFVSGSTARRCIAVAATSVRRTQSSPAFPMPSTKRSWLRPGTPISPCSVSTASRNSRDRRSTKPATGRAS